MVAYQSYIFSISCITTSFIFFKIISLSVEKWLPAPSFAKKIGKSIRFHNIVISLLHSVISSLWVGFSFYKHPDLASDIINNHFPDTHLLVCMSVGYFIHDLIHALRNKSFSEGWEIMIHHCTVISCFGIAALLSTYTSYAVVSLLTEINSVFLHIRQLMNLSDFSKSVEFRVNSLINVATFAVFRLGTIVWMTRWIVLHRDDIPPLMHAIGFLGLVVMTVINIILFARILLKDFWGKIKTELKDNYKKIVD